MKRLVIFAVALFSIAFTQTVSADSLDSIQNNKEEVAARIRSLESDMNELLDEIDTANAEVSALEEKIEQNTKDIEKTKKQITAQEEVVEKRLDQARTQLKALQTSEVNYNIIVSLFQAKSLSEFFQRIYAVTLLTDASQDHLRRAKEDHEKLEQLQEHLDQTAKELASQKEEEKEKEAERIEKVATLKENLAENKALLATIHEKEAAEMSATSVTTASSATSAASASGDWFGVQATGYSTQEAGMGTYTATGINLRSNPRVIAVDPSVIPLGSVVEVEGMGTYIAGDTGGAIHGNIIDIHFASVGDALAWGRRSVRVRIVG